VMNCGVVKVEIVIFWGVGLHALGC
jgi:hypothetical protein